MIGIEKIIKNKNYETYENKTSEFVMVGLNEKTHEFIFQKGNKIIGKFTDLQILKYICYDICPEFLSNVDHTSSIDIITMYVCNVTKINDDIKLTLLDRHTSPFMGRIELVIKLYQWIHEYELNELQNEVNKTNNSKKIIKIIKQFIYLLLNNFLKLASIISDEFEKQQNCDTSEIKKQMLKYSIFVMQKLNILIKTEIDEQMTKFKTLQDDIVKIGEVKFVLNNKITKLEQSVDTQNDQLKEIINKINEFRQSSQKNDHEIIIVDGRQKLHKKSASKSSSKSSSKTSSSKNDDSNCYFTETGSEFNINYLSSDIGDQKSILDEIKQL